MKLPDIKKYSITNHNKKFAGKVIRCKKFNRKSCWELKDIIRWFESVRLGWNINPLIYIHIESCIEHCIDLGLDDDVKYYLNYKNQGYEYITIEGGNRHDATVNFYKEEKLYRNSKEVQVAVIKSVTREEMHDGYVRLAHGKAPNSQEKRTGIFGTVSDIVRKSSEKLENMWGQIKGVTRPRMKDDELVAMLMNFVTKGSFGKTTDGMSQDDNLDEMYEQGNYKVKSFNNIINKLQKCFNSIIDYDTISKKLPKTSIYLLTLIFNSIHKTYKIVDMDLFVKYWYQLYMEKIEDITVIYQDGKKHLSFNELTKGLVSDLKQLKYMMYIIEDEFITFLQVKGAISPTNPDEFNAKHKSEWVQKNKFQDTDGRWYVKVRCNSDNKSFLGNSVPVWKQITIAEAFDGGRYELDHIIPKIDGGPTTIENAELTTKKYNRKKNKNIVNA